MSTIKEKKRREEKGKGRHSDALPSNSNHALHTHTHTQHLTIPKAESALHTARRFTGKEKTKTSEAHRDYLFLYSLYTWQQSWQRHVFG